MRSGRINSRSNRGMATLENNARIAQLVRASALHAEGRKDFGGSSPSSRTFCKIRTCINI